MSNCSRTPKTNLSKKLQKQLSAQLKAVMQVFPNTSFVALIGPRQELMCAPPARLLDGSHASRSDFEAPSSTFDMLKERARLDNMLGIVASLRHAGLEVGEFFFFFFSRCLTDDVG